MKHTQLPLLATIEDCFKQDTKIIHHARQITAHAQEILQMEGSSPSIVIGAATTHDISIREVERKYDSTSSKHQKREGLPIAREILFQLGLELSHIDESSAIIAYHYSSGRSLRVTSRPSRILIG